MDDTLLTPYERGNGNQTTSLQECIAFYKMLAQRFPNHLRMLEIGKSDAGTPIHAGIVSADGVFDREDLKAANRQIFFNNNGIHPGEPEGIDACMAVVRDLCSQPAAREAMGTTVYLFIPVYNVDGCLNRSNSSRVNQDGPEWFGFRGCAIGVDLNRDFIKCDSLNAQVFNRFFAEWDPDVMVDTHTSNGADYAYTMTIIPTQADKLDGEAGQFLRETLMPTLSARLAERGWPACPYVNPVKEIPDDGIEDFLDTPRFSTGYAALHYTIGMMPETHMLKPFRDRYESMKALLEEMLRFSAVSAERIRSCRNAARQRDARRTAWPVRWRTNYARSTKFLFRGFAAKYRPSVLGKYSRLYYDRNEPFEKQIDYYNFYEPELTIQSPRYYVIPQQWHAVIERFRWNQIQMQRIVEPGPRMLQVYHLKRCKPRPTPYESRMFHDEVEVELRNELVVLREGDFLVPLDQPRARYIVETLEPQAHDSFFRWGFFNSVLERKEAYSDYVFEDTATELLQSEPELKQLFEAWKLANPSLVSDQTAVLDFLFHHCRRHREPEWRRYPVFRAMDKIPTA